MGCYTVRVKRNGVLATPHTQKGFLIMTTLTISQAPTKANIQNDYASGEFDAAIGLPPKQAHGEYWRGYLAYTAKTGNAPF